MKTQWCECPSNEQADWVVKSPVKERLSARRHRIQGDASTKPLKLSQTTEGKGIPLPSLYKDTRATDTTRRLGTNFTAEHGFETSQPSDISREKEKMAQQLKVHDALEEDTVSVPKPKWQLSTIGSSSSRVSDTLPAVHWYQEQIQ